MINIGIIGPGRVAERHAKALTTIPNVRLWSVAGRNIESAKEFADRHKAVSNINAYTDLGLMLEDPNLHAVIIATPDKMHTKQILLAAAAGKHILVEKPVCTSSESAQQILTAIEKHPIVLAVAYHMRWHSGLRTIATMAKHNELGKMHYVRFSWAVDFIDHAKWRKDPEYGEWCCLTVLGTHLIDLIRWIMLPTCGEVVSQKNIVNYLTHSTVDVTVAISMQFESGAIAQLFCSVGFNAPLDFDIHSDKLHVQGNNLAGSIEQQKIFINNEELKFSSPNLYEAQLNNFISTITENKQPEVTLQEGLKNVNHLIKVRS